MSKPLWSMVCSRALGFSVAFASAHVALQATQMIWPVVQYGIDVDIDEDVALLGRWTDQGVT